MVRRTTLTLAVLLVVGFTPSGAGASLEHPDLAGTWVAVDCVVEASSTSPACDQPGDDGSTIHLQVGGPAHAPTVVLVDDHATSCADAGARSTVLLARGTGTYVDDGLVVVFDRVGCGGTEPAAWEMALHWDPQDDLDSRLDDELWWDADGDDYGHKWYRPTR